MSPGKQILLIALGAVIIALGAAYVILGPEDTEILVTDEIIIIENKGLESELNAAKITHSEYDIMKKRYDDFQSAYNELVLSQRDVIPYPIDYGYVTDKGFTDKIKGKQWCANLEGHTYNIESLLIELNQSLDKLNAIENKTPQIVKLVDEKYVVLSNLMTKEVNSLEYKYYQFDCKNVFGSGVDVSLGDLVIIK